MTLRRLLEAPIADLTFADVEALIREEAEEGLRFELKRDLQANSGQVDPWMSGGKKLGGPARDGLAKEVVALANAYGGAIVVGVDETDDHPKRARGLAPTLIPNVIECAERVQQALDSLIDPPLPVLEVRGIETPDTDGGGVLVIRTGASTRAPHGYGRPPLAYMRRGSRSEPMTMRDLQSVLFETRSRGERITALLEQRRAALMRMIGKGAIDTAGTDGPRLGAAQGVIWFRCTLVPGEDLQLRADDLGRLGYLIRPQPQSGYAALGAGQFHYGWQPRVGGIETIDSGRGHAARWFVGDEGVVDAYGFLALDTHKGRDDAFAPSLFPPVVFEVLAMGERLRRAARRPEVELVIECEFVLPKKACAVVLDGRMDRLFDVPDGETQIGPYTLGNIEDWERTYTEIQRGIWAALGLRVAEPVTFDMHAWLAQIEAQQGVRR